MNKQLLAIEVGNENLKLAILHQTKDHYSIVKTEVIQLSDKAYDLEGVLDINEVKESLHQGIVSLKAQKMKTALTINSLKKIVRTRDLPLTHMRDLEGIVKYEAEQFLPYGIDQFYIDFRVIGAGTLVVDNAEKEKQNIDGVKVMIAALPKEVMDPYMKLVESLNLKLVSVTLHTDSIFSLGKSHFLKDGKAMIVCDIGSGSTNTILFENKEFIADISSELGVSFVTESFSKKFGLSLQDAYDVLFMVKDFKLEKAESEMDMLYKRIERLNQFSSLEMQQGEEPRDLVELDEAGNPTVKKTYMASHALVENTSEFYGSIQREVSRMMEFYRTRRFGAKVDEVYLCGGGANLAGLVEFLRDRLEINVITTLEESCNIDSSGSHSINLMAAAVGGAIGR